MTTDIKNLIKRAAAIAMNGPITADMQDSDDAKAVAFHISGRILGLGDELPRTDTVNPVSPGGHAGATSGSLWGRETLPPSQADASTQGGNDSVPPAPADAPVSASNEGGDQVVTPIKAAAESPPWPQVHAIRRGVDELVERLAWEQGRACSLAEKNSLLRRDIVHALGLMMAYGCTDEAHHKAWVLDQVARALTGEGYAAWVAEVKAGENGPDTYDWDVGIAP